jgi:hypothetical protein
MTWGFDGCFRDIDSGYCYRKDLEIIDPRDFFTNVDAIKHYKNRIRYMEARWGYSTEIAVTEILSEASHVGSYCELVVLEEGGCAAASGSIKRPYHEDELTFPITIMNWHTTMANYMKDSLKTRGYWGIEGITSCRPIPINFAVAIGSIPIKMHRHIKVHFKSKCFGGI